MPKHIVIENRVYSMDVFVYDTYIFVSNFSICKEYLGRKYSYRIFNKLLQRFKCDIMLESFKTLLPYYKKLGFDILEDEDTQGYYLMFKRKCNTRD